MSFDGLAGRRFGAIIADPPWAWRSWSGTDAAPHRTQEAPYGVLGRVELEALPVASLAASDSVLFLWVIDSHLDQGLALGRAWGFEYKTRAFEWFKTTNDGTRLRMGMGKWTRNECESCLLFSRGKPHRLDAGVRQVIQAPRREHSRKPDEVYDRIERLVTGPYLELFATQRWPGWSGWGDSYPAATIEDTAASLVKVLRRWNT